MDHGAVGKMKLLELKEMIRMDNRRKKRTLMELYDGLQDK